MPMVRPDIHFTCDRCGCELQAFSSEAEAARATALEYGWAQWEAAAGITRQTSMWWLCSPCSATLWAAIEDGCAE